MILVVKQGVGALTEITPAAEVVAQLATELDAAVGAMPHNGAAATDAKASL